MDWSGALTGAASRIWVARAERGVLTSLDAPGSRDAVRDFLQYRRSGAPCLVGLDFAFALPAWYAAAQDWTSIAQVWTAARDHGEDWLRLCPPPFWGRPGVPRPHAADVGLRGTERRWSAAQRPKSVLQIGGAGSVGTGSIRGMPMLLELRNAGWAVWPFDARSTHTLVEIYPRLFTGPLVKSRAAARAAALSAYAEAIPARLRTKMRQSEDAFDAGVSALRMSRAIDAHVSWPDITPESRIEGEIWQPGTLGASSG